MKRFMYLVSLAATLVLAVGSVVAEGATRPDDRNTHGVGAVALERSSGAVRPDDRATHGPGATVLVETTAVAIRPDDRASHGVGSLGDTSPAVRPDDRAWRGIGSEPRFETVDSPTVRGDGFDWADASVGALGAFGLGLLLVGGSVLVLRRQRVTSFS